MIKFIAYGDIFSISGISCYAHGCNCAGAMGKGIALQFKKRFPQMYLQYRKKCLQNQFHPGDVFEFVQGTQLKKHGEPTLPWRPLNYLLEKC